ncbi:MAG: hypothetical protein F4Y44_00875 [Chloroflexi bacterium]|nr:hypothetical protein [Chloroflexota bacterium]
MEKVSALYASFHVRIFVIACVFAPERVRSFHQKLIYDYRQREVVMMHISVNIGEYLPLQFRRRVFRFSHAAAVDDIGRPAAVGHLKRICVYECYLIVFGDVRIGFVNVAHKIGIIDAVQPIERYGDALGH